MAMSDGTLRALGTLIAAVQPTGRDRVRLIGIDGLDLARDKLLVVRSRGGTTEIAEPDQASLSTVKDHLMTPGELLRLDQLEPDSQDLEDQQELRLFAFEPDA
jgi:hypothetical protein